MKKKYVKCLRLGVAKAFLRCLLLPGRERGREGCLEFLCFVIFFNFFLLNPARTHSLDLIQFACTCTYMRVRCTL